MAKKKSGSDRQTAFRIGVTPGRIATARKKGQLGPEYCVKIAEVAEVDPLEVIAAAEILKHPEKKKFWAKYIAATVILSVGIMSQGIDSTGENAIAAFHHAIYYAQCALFALVLSLIAFSAKNGSVRIE